MGATPLFPLFILIFVWGISALTQDQAEASRIVTMSSSTNALQAETFLTYRRVVSAYLVGHPGYVGTVPSAYLSDQGISSGVQAQIGHLAVTSAAGRQLLVFAQQTNGFEVFRQAENDAAIGRVKNGLFEPFITGGTVTALPTALPEGYVVSFVEIGY